MKRNLKTNITALRPNELDELTKFVAHTSRAIVLAMQHQQEVIFTESHAKAYPQFIKAGSGAGLTIGCAVTAKYFVDSVLLARILAISSGILGCGSVLALSLAIRILVEAGNNLQDTISIECLSPKVGKEMSTLIAAEVTKQEQDALVQGGRAEFSQHSRRMDAHETSAKAHVSKTNLQEDEITALKTQNGEQGTTIHNQGATIQEQSTKIQGLEQTLEALMEKFTRFESQQGALVG